MFYLHCLVHIWYYNVNRVSDVVHSYKIKWNTTYILIPKALNSNDLSEIWQVNKTKATRRRVQYKWRQISWNSLENISNFDLKNAGQGHRVRFSNGSFSMANVNVFKSLILYFAQQNVKHVTLSYITLHNVTLHYITLHCITLR